MPDAWRALEPTGCWRTGTLGDVVQVLDAPETQAALAEHEDRAAYPVSVLERLHDAGLAELFVGDSPGPTAHTIFCMNALAAGVSASLAVTLGINALALLPTHMVGTDAQRAWVAERLRMARPAAMLLSEWDHGSDLAANTTRAERGVLRDGAFVPDNAGTHYRLDGEKRLINGVRRAGVLTVLARTDPPGGPLGGASGLSLFLVGDDTPGLTLLDRHRTLPAPSADIGGVRLSGVVVPADRRLGADGGGFGIVHRSLAMSRGGISAFAAGTSNRALRLARAHAHTRVLYGSPILQLDAVADHIVRASALDLLATCVSLKAMLLLGHLGPAASHYAAVAKAAGCRYAEGVVNEGRQVLSARALVAGPYEKVVRDVLLYGVFDGTRHVVLEQVATRLRQMSVDEAPVDGVAMTQAAFSASPRPLAEVVRQRARPWTCGVHAHASALAQLPGVDLAGLADLAQALLSVTRAVVDGGTWRRSQSVRLELASVLTEVEAVIAVAELADPQRRGALGLSAGGDALLVEHVVAERCAGLASALAAVALGIGIDAGPCRAIEAVARPAAVATQTELRRRHQHG